MINTINKYVYNTKQRLQAYDVYRKIGNRFDEMRKEMSEMDDDEYFKSLDELDKISELHQKAYLKCFALQFHSCTNKWFLQVVDGLKENQAIMITDRQYECFIKYAYDTDEAFWKTSESYCRADKYLITLKTYKNGRHSIKKEIY